MTVQTWKDVLGLVGAELGASIEFSHRPGDALHFYVQKDGVSKHVMLSGCYLGVDHKPKAIIEEAGRIVRMKVSEIERERQGAA